MASCVFFLGQVQALQDDQDRQAAEVARMHATTPQELYSADLAALEVLSHGAPS